MSRRKAHTVLALGLFALIVGVLLVTTFSSAATAELVPDGDVTTQWTNTSGGNDATCDGGTHCDFVDEGSSPVSGPETDYVATGGPGTSAEAAVEEYTMTTANNIDTATQLAVNVIARSATDANGGTLDDIDVNIRIGGNLQTAQRITPSYTTSTPWNTYTATFNGSWNQSDIDSLQVQLTRVVQGSQNPTNQQDDVQIATVYTEMTYTQTVLLEQSSFRWFGNEDVMNITDWTELTASAGWSDRSGHSTVVFNGKLWVFGGYNGSNLGDVWSSSDGISWTLETSSPGWTARRSSAATVYDNKIWVFGGCDTTCYNNDVWYSSDGVNWTEATSAAPWTGRMGHTAMTYDGKMWVMGGRVSAFSNDVWSSTDGVNWTEETAAADWGPRAYHASEVFNGAMWVHGGDDDNYANNELWRSTDGINWELITDEIGDFSRYDHTMTSYGGKLWIMGGYTGNYENIVFSSSNGSDWSTVTASANWTGRDNYSATSFDGNLLVLGGASAGSVYYNDVWRYSEEVDIGQSLSTQDTVATAPAEGTPFRLRSTLHANNGELAPSSADLKLQYAQQGGDAVCDPSFMGESYEDVTNYGNDIEQIGTESSANINGANDIFVNDNYAYVTGYFTDSLTVFNISNPSQPQEVGTFSSVTLDGAHSVWVEGSYAYVTTYSGNSLTIIDVSDPSNMSQAGIIASSIDLENASGIVVEGEHAYIAAKGSSSLTIVDVSTVSSPTIVGKASSILLPEQVFIQDGHAYVTTNPNNSGGLTVVDIQNPSSPVTTDSFTSSNFDGANGLYIGNGYAYIASENTDSLRVVDVSDVNNIVEVDSITHSDLDGANDVLVVGQHAVVSNSVSDSVVVIDISNPLSLTYKASLLSQDMNGASSIYYDQENFYVSGYTSNSITVLSILFPSVISFADNTNLQDGMGIASSVDDPTHSGHTNVYQTYEEENNFTNPYAVPNGEDGLWDFALVDNGAPGDTNYCFRIVNSDGSELNSYSSLPVIKTSSPDYTQNSYRWYENQAGVASSVSSASTITGATWPAYRNARLGPYEYNGNLYAVLRGASEEPYIYKSTNGGTWSSVVGSGYMWSSSIDVDVVDSSLFIALHATGNPGAIHIIEFDMATESIVNTFTSTIAGWENISGSFPLFIAARSSTEFVIFHNGTPETINTVAYRRAVYSRYVVESGWVDQNVDIGGAGLEEHWDAHGATVDDNGGVHYFYSEDNNGPLSKTLSPSNVLGGGNIVFANSMEELGNYPLGSSLVDNGKITALGQTFDYMSVIYNFYIETATLSSAPQWGDEISSFSSSENKIVEDSSGPPGAVVVVDGVKYIFYVDANDGNTYVMNDQGSESWTSPELFAAATTQGISATAASDGTGVLYNDNGTVIYKSMTIGDVNVGDPLAAQNNSTSVNTGTPTRLRTLVDVDYKQATNSSFKLQYAVKSGTCDIGFSGESYADVQTASGSIRFHDNANIATGDSFNANVNDPTNGRTAVRQSYVESNPFSLSTDTSIGGSTLWDFSLVGVNDGSYCVRAVKSDGTLLSSYDYIPELTVGTPNSTPSAPTLNTPTDDASGIGLTPTFELRSYDADGDYLQYRIEVCSNSDCSDIIRTINQSDSQTGWAGQDADGSSAYVGSDVLANSTMASYTYQEPSLSNGTQYWWRAYAVDPSGSNTESNASSIHSFTTETVPVQSDTYIDGGVDIRGGTTIGN